MFSSVPAGFAFLEYTGKGEYPVDAGYAGHLVQQLLRHGDRCYLALRPIHAPLRGLLPARRYGIER